MSKFKFKYKDKVVINNDSFYSGLKGEVQNFIHSRDSLDYSKIKYLVRFDDPYRTDWLEENDLELIESQK